MQTKKKKKTSNGFHRSNYSCNSSQVHRIYLVNQETGAPDGIVTLTDVLRYVSQHAQH